MASSRVGSYDDSHINRRHHVPGVHHPPKTASGFPPDRTQYVWSMSNSSSKNQRIYPEPTEYSSNVSSNTQQRLVGGTDGDPTLPGSVVPSGTSNVEGGTPGGSGGATNPNGGSAEAETGFNYDAAVASPSLLSTTNSPPPSAKSILPASGVNNIGSKSRLNPSFYNHLMKMEVWANWIGVNLLAQNYQLDSKGRWRAIGHSTILLYLIQAFLGLTLIREFFGGLLVDSADSRMMLYVGDFSNIYGVHVDRFAFNAFKFCWGLHAVVIYYWIAKGNGKIRKWLSNFEGRWLETAYYVDKSLENESLEKMRSGRKFATKFVQSTSAIATIMVTSLNIYGYVSDNEHSDLWAGYGATIYFAWCVTHMIWFWLTFVINMTAFGHHFLLCRAIHIRFDETKKDLEYAILSDYSVNTKPEHISGLITKHYYVCDMVKQANKHLKIYLFIFYIIFAPHLCLMIYQIIFSTNATTQGRIFIGFLLILSDFFQVYSVSVLSAQITSKSHEPYYAMHGVNKFDNLPENLQLQSTLFMQRISNTVVGLTILDSFVLTGGLISSLVTAIVTYFSVILESS